MTILKQAVILAGGMGKRLRPLTNKVPKPMVLVNNRPFLEYLIEMLKENGVSEIVLLLGYLPNKIVEYFGNGSKFGVNIKYSIGKISDETGTRIKNARALLDKNFLLMYGDNYWPINLRKMVNFYNKMNLEAMVTVYNNKDGFGEYGPKNNIYVSKEGYVLSYDKTQKDSRLNGVDMGFFILNKDIIDMMPSHNFSFEKEILPPLIKKKQLCAFQTDNNYYYITDFNTLKLTEKFLQPKKAIFLDRDVVVNKKAPEHDYVKNWKEFEFLPGSIEAIKLLSQNNYQVYVVTNQRGIARRLMTESDLKDIHNNLEKELKKHNAKIDRIYYCPHGNDNGCECRKPKPGMFFQAMRDYKLDLTKTIFIGDSQSDIQAGKAAGCKTILVTTEKNLLQIVNSLLKTDKKSEVQVKR